LNIRQDEKNNKGGREHQRGLHIIARKGEKKNGGAHPLKDCKEKREKNRGGK